MITRLHMDRRICIRYLPTYVVGWVSCLLSEVWQIIPLIDHIVDARVKVSRWRRSTGNPVFFNDFVVALLLLHLYHIVLPGIEGSVLFVQRNFVASSQGVGRCPTSSYSGSSNVVFARSRIECARFCTISLNCLHYGYESWNGTCTLVSNNPINLSPVEDCLFMMVG